MFKVRSFQPSRADGRSDARVVFDLVDGVEPGTTISYHELGMALLVGLPDGYVVSRSRIGAAARSANRALLKNSQRTLAVVAGIGYRVALAREHRGLALKRELAADRQLRVGLTLLRSVRLDEMDDVNRAAHLAHLQVTQSVLAATQHVLRQQRRQDDVIVRILARVDDLENKQPTARHG